MPEHCAEPRLKLTGMGLKRTAQSSWKAGLSGLAACALAQPAHAASSAYTNLDLDACTVLERFEESGGVRLQCAGHDGIDVFVSEGDLRFDVDYGVANDSWESFGPFNHVGETVEWRIGENGPMAAILRFFLDSGITGTDEDKAQMLVVSKIGRADEPGCVIGVIDAAEENANGVARGVAAMQAHFACGSDAPVAIGPDGTLATSLWGAVAQ
jgi:hypothetical protein